jgi:peptide/nickel transport system permease protein
LGFGLSITLVTLLFGTLLGAVCAYAGGLINRMFMRFTNALLAFPLMAAIPFMFLLFRFLLMKISPGTADSVEEVPAIITFLFGLFEKISTFSLAVMFLAWIPYARLVNDQILRLKQTEFIEAARSLGARNRRIILRHLIPNSLAPVIVWATKSIGALVVLQATFTFIGLDNGSAWAALLLEGRFWIIGPGGNLLTHWWVYLPITLAIIFFGFVWNLMGDEMNSLLNPRERND